MRCYGVRPLLLSGRRAIAKAVSGAPAAAWTYRRALFMLLLALMAGNADAMMRRKSSMFMKKGGGGAAEGEFWMPAYPSTVSALPLLVFFLNYDTSALVLEFNDSFYHVPCGRVACWRIAWRTGRTGRACLWPTDGAV